MRACFLKSNYGLVLAKMWNEKDRNVAGDSRKDGWVANGNNVEMDTCIVCTIIWPDQRKVANITAIVLPNDFAEALRAPTPLLEDVEGQALACPSD